MKRIIGILLFLFFFAACGKEQNFVPDYPVRYDVTLQEFGIYAKNNVLLVPNQGVAGLMIVKSPTGAYLAFDRCSTVNPEKACAVTPDDSGFTATDPCSGGKFLLLDGSPQKAPAERSLKRYSVVISGPALSVRN
ncbi:Rieske (2Fe-2S) protein [Pedobacter ureilyticus]|jgi:hypothetical protein|uniref:Rieske domain-containing protein n=1 Tax=Pedobacter ureilyticus TaxID=1393051 RepID=A0ABW9J2B2_9SPHI|nr:hypothetical protein [Pedobacter helvus]